MSNEESTRAKRKFVKRAPNYSDAEKRFLVDRILRAYPVILDKRVDNRTKKQKARAWELLAAEFNSQGISVNRNPTTLRTCWENLKRLKKNDCVRSVLERHLAPKKPFDGISEDGVEVIDLVGQQQKYDNENDDVKARHLTVEVKIDEDVIFLPSTNAENCEQENNNNDQPSDKNPLPETIENVDYGNIENANWINAASSPNNNKGDSARTKNTAVKRTRVAKRRPGNIRNIWIKKEIELFKTLKQHAEEYAKSLATKKIELFQTLKNNAEAEGKLKQQILTEQLKQEKIRTAKMQSLI